MRETGELPFFHRSCVRSNAAAYACYPHSMLARLCMYGSFCHQLWNVIQILVCVLVKLGISSVCMSYCVCFSLLPCVCVCVYVCVCVFLCACVCKGGDVCVRIVMYVEGRTSVHVCMCMQLLVCSALHVRTHTLHLKVSIHRRCFLAIRM